MEKDSKLSVALKMMKVIATVSGTNVPAPQPFLDEKAAERLSANGMDVWTNICIDFERLSKKDAREVARLLLIKTHTMMDLVEEPMNTIRIDARDASIYVMEHPEYKEKKDESLISEEINRLLED